MCAVVVRALTDVMRYHSTRLCLVLFLCSWGIFVDAEHNTAPQREPNTPRFCRVHFHRFFFHSRFCFVLSGTEQAWCFSSVLLLLNRPIHTPVTVPEYLARALAVHYCVVFPSGSYACPMIWFSTNIVVWTCLMALYVEFLFISHTYPAWELPFVLVHKLYF